MKRWKKWGIATFVVVALAVAGVAVANGSGAATPSQTQGQSPQSEPPALGSSQTQAAAAVTKGWFLHFGSGYGGVHAVASNRNPFWEEFGGNGWSLSFQADCNLVDRDGDGVARWASNTVAQLRPCTWAFNTNADVTIRNSAGQLGWHTGIIHSGTVFAEMAFYSNGCLIEWYWNVPTQQWLNQWRNNSTCV